jgi:hypothetical protein
MPSQKKTKQIAKSISNFGFNNNALVIGDSHEPFCHPNYRSFCVEVANIFKVSKVFHIGDEVDNHAISYHESNPDGRSAGDEYIEAYSNMQQWFSEFPEVDVCIGNHSALHMRKAQTAGLPKAFVKTYKEVWSAPDGWRWDWEFRFGDVLLEHGINSSGQNGAITRAKDNRMSTVIGHIHSFGGVQYSASDRDIIFGMNVGCGIDITRYAFEYGKQFKKRPTLGCGVLLDGGRAGIFIPMDMGKKVIITKK